MEHLDTFLAGYPPFDRIGPEQLRELAAGAVMRGYEKGENALVEDGPPTPGLWVVLTGSMELVHEGEPIQVLEPGECFGHPSLLTGMAPAYTVRARGPSTCALFSAEAGRRVLGTEPGSAYVAQTMRKRLVQTGQTMHGLPEVGSAPVSEIMHPSASFDPEATVREAAVKLSVPGTHALLVRLGSSPETAPGADVGVITDADIRAFVAAGGWLDAPARSIAKTTLPTVRLSEPAIEATVEMLAADTEHAIVLDGQRVCGVLSAADVLALDARSPIALRRTLLGAPDEAALLRASARLPRLFVLLLRAGLPPGELARVLSLQLDAITARLIDFSIWRRGEAPVAWTWLQLGSAARREVTLASDQDNALAYATPPVGQEPMVDEYFRGLAADVNDGLAGAGLGSDNNGVLASEPLWRMSAERWLATFDEVLRVPDESHLVRASVAFDFRSAAGGLTLTPGLTATIRSARRHPQFMRLLARTASGYPVALGFRGHLATGRDGDPDGKLDLKRGAIVPVVNLARFHALRHGVTISPTLDRIAAVAALGGFEPGMAQELSEAFSVITRLRFEHHAQRIADGAVPDNLIDPGELTPLVRNELRESLLAVRRAQRQLEGWVPGGQ
jgi:CBS domain-containing protein